MMSPRQPEPGRPSAAPELSEAEFVDVVARDESTLWRELPPLSAGGVVEVEFWGGGLRCRADLLRWRNVNANIHGLSGK